MQQKRRKRKKKILNCPVMEKITKWKIEKDFQKYNVEVAV